MSIEFTPATGDRVEQLKHALHANAAGDGASILMRRGDGSFDGVAENDDLTDREVINAIKSVPCHY